MPRCFIGKDGYYEIFNQSSIIHQKINEGKTSYKFKVYNSVRKVPSPQDRWRIEQIILGNITNYSLIKDKKIN